MSIERVISRFTVQTAVYWANPTNAGYGTLSYDTPVEIKVRWEQKTKIITNRKSEEIISNSVILSNTEMEEEEVLFLGTLSDVTALGLEVDSGETYPHPTLIPTAFKIVTKEKIPFVRATSDFVRIYYLKPNWEQKV